MTDVKGMDKLGQTTAKLMTQLEDEFEDDSKAEITHVMVIAEMSYEEGGKDQSHVVLQTDVDSRIVQIGMATAAQNAALYGDPIGDDE